jgi:type IV secretion system protein VirB10
MDGSLFSSRGAASQSAASGSYAERYPYIEQNENGAGDYLKSLEALQSARPSTAPAVSATAYDAQNNQADKKSFYSGGAEGGGGYFLDENTIWIGSVIPGVLVTGVNTDLPGEVIARVTQNVYDSRTGKHLLIPQGTLLSAKYNSGISYAQSRVQIIWDTLIRPDGFMLALGGMNGVDNKGYSGSAARYKENYFQYLKAAGIITMFSAVSARMTGEAAKYQSAESAGAIAAGNAQMIGQLGGNIINRALDIQPTLTIDQGTSINIMLNKNIHLPPLDDYPVSEKYSRRKK